MGGFLGIGKSAEERELERQNQLRQEEAERARREAEIRLAEKKAKKGQEAANIKLGTQDKAQMAEAPVSGKQGTPSSSLAVGAGGGKKGKTGIQL